MCDLSHLLTYCSKEFQRFDVLPFYPMNVADKVLLYLIAAGDSFKEGKIPDPIHLHVDSKQKEYVVWETFNNSAREILEKQKFENVNLISPSERGRVTRRSTRIGCDKESCNLLFDQQLRSYGSYLHELANQFVFRFHPWPKWLTLCNKCFNFENDLSQEKRKTSFNELLELPSSPNPLLDNEKIRLNAEYSTFLLNIVRESNMLEKEKYTQTELWYLLLTEEDFFSNCQHFINFAISFLNWSIKETIVESEVSSLEDVETRKRPMKHETSVKLNFISSNGPHPLASLPLVKDF